MTSIPVLKRSAQENRTVALYQRDETLREHATKIAAVQQVSALSEADRLLFKQAADDDLVIITEETIFYAQGGGQPCDTGIMISLKEASLRFKVTSVRSGADGQILHLGTFDMEGVSFTIGERVNQVIDGDRRLLNSRIHTAGHIIGLAVRHLSDAIPNITELKAQHYPDLAFVDFQGTIDSKHKEAIQEKANEFVAQAMPVVVYWWNEAELREKCAIVPAAAEIPQGELIRAVDIEGAGAYPCGGTHVPDTSKVGKIRIKKISRSKGNSKVSYIVT